MKFIDSLVRRDFDIKPLSSPGEEREILIKYAFAKLQCEDWHAVAHASMDLRELDVKIKLSHEAAWNEISKTVGELTTEINDVKSHRDNLVKELKALEEERNLFRTNMNESRQEFSNLRESYKILEDKYFELKHRRRGKKKK